MIGTIVALFVVGALCCVWGYFQSKRLPPAQKWMPGGDLIAQFAHGFAAVAIVLTFARVADHYHASSLELFGISATFAFAGVKEFIVDWFVEGQFFSDNFEDWRSYMYGILAAVFVLIVFK